MSNVDRVALISGALGGIATAAIPTLVAEGFEVVGLDHRPGTSGGALDLVADVTDRTSCGEAIARVRDEFGRLDALIHCAGINLTQPFADLDLTAAGRVMDVNLWGTVNLTHAATGLLTSRPNSSMVVLTSTNGDRGYVGGAAYGMSKGALGALVRTLAVEWAAIPVRVNAVAPAIVPTQMNADRRTTPGFTDAKVAAIPIGRMIDPREAAEAIAFLAGSRSSAITGITLPVDGGTTIRG